MICYYPGLQNKLHALIVLVVISFLKLRLNCHFVFYETAEPYINFKRFLSCEIRKKH